MTGSNAPQPADDDQTAFAVQYGHGRMPFFMKLAWVLFIIFITTYVAMFLIPAAGTELAK